MDFRSILIVVMTCIVIGLVITLSYIQNKFLDEAEAYRAEKKARKKEKKRLKKLALANANPQPPALENF